MEQNLNVKELEELALSLGMTRPQGIRSPILICPSKTAVLCIWRSKRVAIFSTD